MLLSICFVHTPPSGKVPSSLSAFPPVSLTLNSCSPTPKDLVHRLDSTACCRPHPTFCRKFNQHCHILLYSGTMRSYRGSQLSRPGHARLGTIQHCSTLRHLRHTSNRFAILIIPSMHLLCELSMRMSTRPVLRQSFCISTQARRVESYSVPLLVSHKHGAPSLLNLSPDSFATRQTIVCINTRVEARQHGPFSCLKLHGPVVVQTQLTEPFSSLKSTGWWLCGGADIRRS